jgi:hypothetical protein
LQKRKQLVPNYALLSNFIEIEFQFEYRNRLKSMDAGRVQHPDLSEAGPVTGNRED